MSKTHTLKIWPEWYEPVASGLKNFEIRRNDRAFEVGDMIVFEEFRVVVGEYTGRKCARSINYIASRKECDFGEFSPDFVVLSLGSVLWRDEGLQGD